MRDIKYRAYDNNTKQFEYWSAKENKYGGIFWEMVKRPEFEPAEQYTGLKDKNGKEIYEGDVISCLAYDNNYQKHLVRGDVEFEEFEYVINNCYDSSWPCVSFKKVDILNVKVIGNIHENPELLKDKEDNNG